MKALLVIFENEIIIVDKWITSEWIERQDIYKINKSKKENFEINLGTFKWLVSKHKAVLKKHIVTCIIEFMKFYIGDYRKDSYVFSHSEHRNKAYKGSSGEKINIHIDDH